MTQLGEVTMRFSSILWAGILTCCAARAAEIVVGGDQGWTLGVDYQPITASVGDELVFNWSPGMHNVWSLPSADCDFSADGAKEEAAADAGTWRKTLDSEGDFWFGCQIGSHCTNGMLVKVSVAGGDSAMACPMPPNDTIVMPEGYYPYMTWDVEGVLNYTCNGTDYTLLGVIANQTDAENGTYAGYGYSAIGAEPGVYIPTVVYTSPDNSTVLGTLQTSTDNMVNVPSANPDSGFDYRRTVVEQTGDLEPVLYMVRSNTTGGAAPTESCSDVGTMVQVYYQATLTLYACDMAM